MLAVGLLGAVLILASGMRPRNRWSRLPWHIGVLLAGAAGSLLLLMWLVTGHEDTWNNWMVLLLNPFWWLLWRQWRKPFRVVLFFGLLAASLLGALILAWPGLIQDWADQLALVLPPLLAILAVAWRDQFGLAPQRSGQA